MPGRLNARAIFDPRFTAGIAFVGERAMTSSILVRRRNHGVDTDWNFDAGKRPDETGFDVLWRGDARVQPNKDWRARGYVFGEATTVFQACRFQVSLAENEWDVAAPELEQQGWAPGTTDFQLRDEDEVIITRNYFPALDRIRDYIYRVRNPSLSGNAGLQNLLCDVDLKAGVGIGNP